MCCAGQTFGWGCCLKRRVWDGGQTEMRAVNVGMCAECSEDDGGVDCVERVDVVRWCEEIAEKGRTRVY